MSDYPWVDGKLTVDEFKELLKDDDQKAVFFDLPDKEAASILKESADLNDDVKSTLDKLAKYLKSRWFRGIALSKAKKYGLSAKEADELARIWREHKDLLEEKPHE